MRPKASQLAGRDPAKAALLGAFDGTDFGVERSAFGAAFDGDMGDDYDDDFHGEFEGEFGEEMAGEFGGRHRRRRHRGQAAPVVAAAPQQLTPEQRRALWEYRQRQANTARHRRLIHPNEGSDIKLERYSFSLFNLMSSDPTLGTPGEVAYSGSPDVKIRPERVIMNPPCPGFVTVADIKVGNVSATIGGNSDAFEYSPVAVGTHLNIPTINTSTRASVLGNYTGFVPSGYSAPKTYPFTVTFQGISEMTA